MDGIEEKLMSYIKRECLSKSGDYVPELDENLFDAGIVDSAGLVSFIAFVEREYDITIPDEDLLPENFNSIVRIAGYIDSRICENSPGG